MINVGWQTLTNESKGTSWKKAERCWSLVQCWDNVKPGLSTRLHLVIHLVIFSEMFLLSPMFAKKNSVQFYKSVLAFSYAVFSKPSSSTTFRSSSVVTPSTPYCMRVLFAWFEKSKTTNLSFVHPMSFRSPGQRHQLRQQRLDVVIVFLMFSVLMLVKVMQTNQGRCCSQVDKRQRRMQWRTQCSPVWSRNH